MITTVVPAAAARFADLARAWNEADGTAFGAVFCVDADFVDIRGDHHTGRSAVAHGHQALFDSLYAGSIVRYQVDSTAEVAPGCLVTVATAVLRVPGGPMRGVHRSRMTAVLVQRDGRWLIRAFHNTLRAGDG